MDTVRRQIEVTRQVRKEIKAAFKCSDMALWRALTFWNDTDMSRRIRKLAFAKARRRCSTRTEQCAAPLRAAPLCS